MSTFKNALGQPIGSPVPNWMPCPQPLRVSLQGAYCRIEPLSAANHAVELFAANQMDRENAMWTYMGYGPFSDEDAYRKWVEDVSHSEDPLFFAIIDKHSGKAVGVASYLRIDPANGVIEVGNIAFSPRMRCTTAGTEAMYLMMKQVFETMGYRRYEWKCDSLNAASRSAASRYGFQFEGIFQKAVVYKNRNRDTAWFAITDQDWPMLDQAFKNWLSDENHDPAGGQIASLQSFMRSSLASEEQ